VRETTLQTPRSGKKEGEEVLKTADGAEIFPLQPVMKTLVRQAVAGCSWRSMVEQTSTCSPWRTPRWSRRMPEGSCDPVGSPCWSRLLPGPVDPWTERSPCWSRFAGRACDPAGRTHIGEVCGELSPVRGTSR